MLQGVVAFCPSFAHCDQLYTRWSHTGLLQQLSNKKEVFREPRAASEVDSMLQRYAECISRTSEPQSHKQARVSETAGGGSANGSSFGSAGRYNKVEVENSSVGSGSSTCTGGLMLCVVGGKLSEGINFSDGFGRYTSFVLLEMSAHLSIRCSKGSTFSKTLLPFSPQRLDAVVTTIWHSACCPVVDCAVLLCQWFSRPEPLQASSDACSMPNRQR